jgi:hypothetical protein
LVCSSLMAKNAEHFLVYLSPELLEACSESHRLCLYSEHFLLIVSMF